MPINVPPNPREKQLHRRTSRNYGRCACKSRSIKSWKVLQETRWNWRKNLQNWSKEILTDRKCGQVERFAVGVGHSLLLYFRIIPTKFLLLSIFVSLHKSVYSWLMNHRINHRIIVISYSCNFNDRYLWLIESFVIQDSRGKTIL